MAKQPPNRHPVTLIGEMPTFVYLVSSGKAHMEGRMSGIRFLVLALALTWAATCLGQPLTVGSLGTPTGIFGHPAP